MKQYYIEVYHPPCGGLKWRVWCSYPGDALSPDLKMFLTVWADDMEEALAKCLCGEGNTLLSPDAKKLQLV